MKQTVIVYNLFCLALTVGELLCLARLKPRTRVSGLVVLGGLLVMMTLFGVFIPRSMGGFGRIQLFAWAVFVHYQLFLVGAAVLFFRRNRMASHFCLSLTVCIGLVGLDSFLLEPHWLEVTRLKISSKRIADPLRVAVLADLQTDNVGRYEERILELVAAEEPDLVLLAGDYLQTYNQAAYEKLKRDFHALMKRSPLKAPLGTYAVKGNVDWPDWSQLFSGLGVVTFERTSSLDLGPVVLTGLTLKDSSNPALSVSSENKFHIVLGHMPDYSLGQVEGDLLIAGHTHGGQVRMPLLGPIFTLSKIPRAWASGMTLIDQNKYLLVSRGIGMERGQAPRMRFLCRPELVIVNLVPG